MQADHINDCHVTCQSSHETGLSRIKDVGVSMLAFGLGGPCHARNKGKVRERVGSVSLVACGKPSLWSLKNN